MARRIIENAKNELNDAHEKALRKIESEKTLEEFWAKRKQQKLDEEAEKNEFLCQYRQKGKI